MFCIFTAAKKSFRNNFFSLVRLHRRSKKFGIFLSLWQQNKAKQSKMETNINKNKIPDESLDFCSTEKWKIVATEMATKCRSRNLSTKHLNERRAVVVAQLVERSLPTPEIRGSIPISDINIDQYSTNCNSEKTKIKKKEAGKGPSFKKINALEARLHGNERLRDQPKESR